MARCLLWVAASMRTHNYGKAALVSLLLIVPARASADVKAGPSVWIEPLGTAFFAVDSAVNDYGLRLLYLPVGATVPVGAVDLDVELTLISHTEPPFGDVSDGVHELAAILSAGPRFPLFGERRNGFFAEPKLQATWIHPTQGGTDSSAIELGLDVGYQLTSGRLSLAFLIGISGGYGFNVTSDHACPIIDEVSRPAPRSNRSVYDTNLNLFRIGATF